MIFDLGGLIIPPQVGTPVYKAMVAYSASRPSQLLESKKERNSMVTTTTQPLIVSSSKLSREDWLEVLNVKMNAAQDVLSRKAPLHSVWMDADTFLSVTVTVERGYAEYSYRSVENGFEHTGSQRYDLTAEVNREYVKLFNNYLFDAESFGDLKYAIRDATGVHKE